MTDEAKLNKRIKNDTPLFAESKLNIQVKIQILSLLLLVFHFSTYFLYVYCW